MANPTTNYGFVLPTASDLVTDLPADFDVALQGVDTRLKALQPGTTAGDLAYSSATADTNVRLGIGTANQVLRVNSGATAPEWATVAAGASFTQLAATATNSGSTVTVSGLSGYNTLWISWEGVGTNTAGASLDLRFNADTGSNYRQSGVTLRNASNVTNMEGTAIDSTRILLGEQGASAGNVLSGGLMLFAANTTTVKVGQMTTGAGGNTSAVGRSGNVLYTGTSVISSVSIITGATFDEGTLRVCGSLN